MTSFIFEDWLNSINMQFKNQKRKVLLFIDNAPSHTESELSNIKLIFLPANTTTITQPLNQGIIKNFKVFYRKKLVEHLIANVNAKNQQLQQQQGKRKRKDKNPMDINVMHAITWINLAWNQVSETTIKNGFAKCNFPVNVRVK